MSQISSYEEHILKVLKKEKIPFEREHAFIDLRKGTYRFDIWIESKNICIEIQGEQHYKYVGKFHKTQSDFLKGKERDRRKISYCLAHGITLYCIPYWEVVDIQTFADVCAPRHLARDKFHNDKIWREYQKSISKK